MNTTIEQKVRSIVFDLLCCYGNKPNHNESLLVEDFHADELDFVEIAIKLEEQFNIKIGNIYTIASEEPSNINIGNIYWEHTKIRKVQDIIDVVKKLVQKQKDKPLNRMYILVLDDLPIGHAINTACHAAVACTLKYQDTPEVKEWLKTKFRKITCKVNRQQFDKAMELENNFVIMTELNLDGRETAIAFKPRTEYNKFFKFLPLYK